MINKIFLIFLVFVYISFNNLVYAEDKIPLNDNQKNLINKYQICEAYSRCALNALEELIKISNIKTEFYDIILYNFIDLLIWVGEIEEWMKYEYLIDNYLMQSDKEMDSTKVYISSLWGWRLYSVKEIQNYDKSLKLLNSAINQKGNVEMTGTAYYSLGVIYEQGRAVKQDYKKALKYYFDATERGDYYAYNRIAIHYILGNKHLDKNFNKATKYLKLSNSSWADNSDISLLKILFNKQRLPNDIFELENWIVDDFKENRSFVNFITLAHGFALIEDYTNAYKYHYINTKVNNEDNAATNSIFELKNYKDTYIKEDQIIILEKEATKIINY